ncbi:MAG TPA: slipin family protein [Candidatus Obscuribacter sp.]|nr:slipin family protein [Candidatus Obscuribacter sp.]MBK9281287.1 slipin family protein [Candidatus Obscuribacter sp.]MBL8081915.1 slipin family protein [Candidatus Obscuribacter sp.]HMW88446.1 slipin family protein [Candidatus Obscuribacter sp.]HMX47676.1 slipin family protein [Candidatus Obscuribacter sp.]
MGLEIIIKDTHRGLWYEDGVLTKTLEAGRYKLPKHFDFLGLRNKKVEVTLVDMRERELTIKGQEILTADKVAIRVSIVVQFRVMDPRAATHEVEKYEDRLYTDVQLAARRSLAAMNLEEILTNRNRLSEDILHDVKEQATKYGVNILRADVKDLIFPGNLQEIMNKVLAAERMAEAALIEARTKAEQQKIESETKAHNEKMMSKTLAESKRTMAESEAEVKRIRTTADTESLRLQAQAAAAYADHPALLRLRELETMAELGKNANARLYVGFEKNSRSAGEE